MLVRVLRPPFSSAKEQDRFPINSDQLGPHPGSHSRRTRILEFLMICG
jgi:hypothetical protein